MLILVLLALLTLVAYIYVRWVQVKQYWAKRNVSHTAPHPLLGSMTFLQRENAEFIANKQHDGDAKKYLENISALEGLQLNKITYEAKSIFFRRMYEQYKEPYIGMWIFWRPALLVNSTEIAKNILIRDQANFRNRLASSGTTDPVGQLNLFSLNDPLWTVIRKHLTILFTGSKLRGVQKLMTEKSKELVERIENERQKARPMNLRSVMTDFSTDVIGTASFGLVSDATLSGTSHMRNITEEFTKFDFLRGLSWCSNFFLPEVADVFRCKMFPSASTEFMRKILRKIIAQRGGIEQKVTEPRDLPDILIKLKQEAGEELNMTENMMLAQAAVFLQGGFETTATTIALAIYELAFSPEVQEKLFIELQEANDKYGDDFLDATVLSQLTYLNCVIYEVLRKYPIFSWLDRVALQDYKVNDNLTIQAGTPVYVNVVGIHYDPNIYPEPDKFKPDRFLRDNKIDIKPSAFMPFGEGPRICIGQRLGKASVRHGVAAVILNYEVRSLPNAPKPNDVKLEKNGLLTVPGETICVEFVPRKTG